MKGREIVLALLIIGAGIFIFCVQTGRLNLEFDGPILIFGHAEEFTFEETQEISAPLPPELRVLNAHGSVDIQGGDIGEAKIIFRKRIWRRNEKEAKKVADALQMIITRDDQKLILSTNREDFRRKGFETHFKISAPAGTAVLVKNSYGLVRVFRTGTTDISNPHGEVAATEIEGPLTIVNSHEDVEARDVQSDCRITGRHAAIEAADVRGHMIIDHAYGSVRLENIGGDTTVNGSHSELTAKDLKGRMNVESSYEKIALSDIGPAIIRARHGDIQVERASGPLEIEDNHAEVRAVDIRGNLRIEGTDVKISAVKVAAEEIRISSSHENVELRDFAGKASVWLSYGDLALEPAAVGPMDVQAKYSNIWFLWPAGAERLSFQAQARSGAVHWGLAEKPEVQETNGLSVIKAFLKDHQEPAIKLSTSYGDIRVEEGRPQK
jgi:hypothetical protein